MTHLLHPSSPAINNGDQAACNIVPGNLEQRGGPRTSGPQCDIGSVEIGAFEGIEILELEVKEFPFESGLKMVYVANRQLHLRSMHELESRPIPGTEDADGVLNPVFSPDGNSLAFVAGNTLRRVPVTGGAAVTVCPIDGNGMGVSWGNNDEIIFGQGQSRNILRVSGKGGKPETLVSVQDDEVAFGPQILPGGRAVLFTLAKSAPADRWEKAQIVVQTLGSNDRKVVVEGGSDARFIPTGHIVYALGGTLFAKPFDLRNLDVTGGPVPIVEGVLRANNAQTGVAHFSVSDTGSLIYVPGPTKSATGTQNSMAFVDRNGGVKKFALPDSPYFFPRISPDGKQLAYETNDGKEGNIWVYDLSGGKAPLRLTFKGNNRFPVWSGDGERVVFMSDREGDGGLFWQRADGSSAERLTKPEKGMEHRPDSWPPKGQFFSFTAGKSGSWNSVWVFSLQDKKDSLFASEPSSFQTRSAFSPDGRWLAYSSDETRPIGNNEVYVQPYPATGSKFKALGAVPVTVNSSGIYDALKSGKVDAQENPLAYMHLFKHAEVMKYVSITNHMWSGFNMLAHLPTWKRLPDGVKTAIERNAARYVRLQRQDQQALNMEARRALARRLAINEANSATFRPRLSGVYATWKEKLGTRCWSLLEAASGRLA
jgi:Tol biopolymer transport system component